MTIRITNLYSDDSRIAVLTPLVGRHLCVDVDDQPLGCGELLKVDDEGITLWCLGDATLFVWDSFSITVG